MRRFRAFTLIELLVVIAIIAILAAILFPVFAQARESARKTSCLSNMKQLNLAVQQYIQDYDERFPCWDWAQPQTADSGSFWDNAVYPYVKNYKVYQCPDDVLQWPHNEGEVANGTIDYAGTADKGLHDAFRPCYNNGVPISGCQYFWSSPNNPNYDSYGLNEGVFNQKLARIKSPAAYVLQGEGLVGWFNGWEDSSGSRDNHIAARTAFANQSAGCCMMWEDWGTVAQWLQHYSASDLDAAARHAGGNNFTFVDGHAKFYKWQTTTFGFTSPRT